MHILWVSKFAPTASQVGELKKLYGAGIRVVQRDIWNSAEAAAEFREGGYRDLVAVVPTAVLAALCREGLTPLWSEAVAEPDPRRIEFRGAGGRGFRFDRFMRVRGVSLDLAPVEPSLEVARVLRVTRHRALPGELDELRRLFPLAEVRDDPRPFRGGREILDRARQARADEVLVVAPWGVYDQLVKSGMKPLYAKVERGRFRSLHRLCGVRIDLEEL